MNKFCPQNRRDDLCLCFSLHPYSIWFEASHIPVKELKACMAKKTFKIWKARESVTNNVISWRIQKLKTVFTWQASCPFSPPAQKLLAGRMKIFSVTELIFRTHSLSLTIGTRASRIRSGMGPAKQREKLWISMKPKTTIKVVLVFQFIAFTVFKSSWQALLLIHILF